MSRTAAHADTPRDPAPDWAGFYRSFQKPGYIPGFEIGHKLGGGVFGVVYKARRESIGKPYAIKFLKVEDPAVRDQVLQELDTVSLFAQVDHPNLVSIEDKGVADGIPYIVMGYAGEETLKARLEEKRLSREEALSCFVQIARGVQALHEHSLVHFDLKPANVFLKGDVARVGDYGLSKLITETAMSLSTGRGTPYYMAPEMLRRKGDHRSDIYSLGVILYECLCGDVPFKGDSEWEVLKAHEEKPVEFTDGIAGEHRPVVSRMLEKDPEKRYQSLAEVLSDLQAPVHLGDSIVIPPARKRPEPKPQRTSLPTAEEVVAKIKQSIPPPVADLAKQSTVLIAPITGFVYRWWPWTCVGIGLAILFSETLPYARDESAVGITILSWGGLILLARLFHYLGSLRRPPRRHSVSLAAMLPWLMIAVGLAVLMVNVFPRSHETLAVAIVFMQIGGLALVYRGIRWLFSPRAPADNEV